jgi:hypothetical protein
MSIHKLTKQQQVKGLRKALRSWRTPPWLKPSIRCYLQRMEAELRREGRLSRKTTGRAGP